MLKLVSFDFWCTLVCFNLEELNKMKLKRAKDFHIALSERGYKFDEKTVSRAIKDARIELDETRSKTNKEFTTEQTVEVILDKLGIKNDYETQNKLADVYSTAMLNMGITLQPGAIKVLEEIRQKQIKIGLISNTEHGIVEQTLLKKFNIAQFFNLLIFSCELGIRKPASEIFNKLLLELDTKSINAVHVGDRLIDDVWGAKRIGMKAIYLKPSIDYHEKQIVKPDITIGKFIQLPSALLDIFKN